MNDKTQQLKKRMLTPFHRCIAVLSAIVVKYLGDQDPYLGNSEVDADVESDCEGDSPEVTNESPERKGELELLPRAVLTTGSFSAYVHSHFLSASPLEGNNWSCRWKSLFFYLCAGEILFAPLKSQGTDFRSDYVRGKTVEAAPPPCSPKSVYILANLVW